MTFVINNRDTERLARQLARETGESLAVAIHRSLEERLARLKDRRRRMLSQVTRVLERVDALPILDTTHEDEILAYDSTE